ncbi:twin-arginine translocase TatA/TatE family subunit [Alkalitalea saponilacus]|uniref:Sec-independent protein translocase protein TatA n=1 Tax=Alkalitalea saponilacus TaxID=889453 RepID=A0A1T5FWQ4_9BACT|nr:twin-arginine translocase TatA/TatE family subunit [Alkalitalea saponilacus]ASB49513.1 twin-arginine translocase TatA/TatE family subunit [Alkalitalea saponilacus]SKC00530.1 sec-independent protein translocase protein TatA [Alkalitalea saponilacus]
MTSQLFLLGMPGGWELIVIILIVVLLFGGRKIPELMKGLGQGMKEFKKARNEKDEDNDKNSKENPDALKD